MSRIKGRYVAQVVLDFDIERKENTSFEVVRENMTGGELTFDLQEILRNGLHIDGVTFNIEQLFADVYEVE